MNKNIEECVRNPGTFSNLTDKCRNVFPVFFDGFKVTVNRALSEHFKVTHCIYLSSVTPGNYRLGVTYLGDRSVTVDEKVPVVTGDVDGRGHLNASLYHLFGCRFKVRFDCQMTQSRFTTSQLTSHYFGDSFTASALVVSPDLLNNKGGLILQYLQSVTPRTVLGVELACLCNISRPPRLDSQVAVVVRHSTPHTVWAATVAPHTLALSCYKAASQQLEFGVELDTNLRAHESSAALAYKVTLKDREIVFRGSVDTNCNVGSVFEKRMFDTPFMLSLSANLNHKTNNFRLGFGFTVN